MRASKAQEKLTTL